MTCPVYDIYKVAYTGVTFYRVSEKHGHVYQVGLFKILESNFARFFQVGTLLLPVKSMNTQTDSINDEVHAPCDDEKTVNENLLEK